MKTYVSSALQAHLAGPALTVAWAWFLKRTDGQVFGFTTHVADQYVVTLIPAVPLIVGQPAGSVLCRSSPGITPTDIATADTLSQANLDIDVALDALGVSEDDIRAGLWRSASVEIALYNYADLSMGTNTVFYGTIGAASGGDISVKLEQRGLSQPLEQDFDDVTGPMCRNRLGDTRCGVDLTPYTKTGTIVSPTEDRVFVDPSRNEADDWWTRGEITITSALTGRVTVVDVKHSLSNGTIELADEVYYGMAAGDAYSITPGCNKLLKTSTDVSGTPYTGDCLVKFHNVLRFRGEPEIPGQIAIQQYGGQTLAS